MPCSLWYAAAVPGVCCPTICLPGKRCITTSACGNEPGSGKRSWMSCARRCAPRWAVSVLLVPPSLMPNRSKVARFVALRRATMGQKKIKGRKRHLFVDRKALAAGGSGHRSQHQRENGSQRAVLAALHPLAALTTDRSEEHTSE